MNNTRWKNRTTYRKTAAYFFVPNFPSGEIKQKNCNFTQLHGTSSPKIYYNIIASPHEAASATADPIAD